MKNFKWFLVIPTLVIIILVVIGPLLYALYISFNDWHIVNPESTPTFNYFNNYIKLFKSERFYNSLIVSGKLLLLTLPFELLLGLIVALALENIHRFRGIVTSVMLIPTMIAPIAVGIIWLMLFSTKYGPINYFLKLFGQDAIIWTASKDWSLFAIAVAEIWEWTPFVIVLFLAGIVVQPVELYEAATVDGADRWRVLKYIKLPLLKPVILVTVIFRTVDILKIFEIPFVLTEGGPGNETEVISIFIYRQGFQFWEIPYAAAASFILLIVIIILVNIYYRSIKL